MRPLSADIDQLGRVEDRLRMGERLAQHVGAQRLEQIVLDAADDEVAVQSDIVDLAGRDHDGTRLADLGQRVDVVQRVAGLGEVDEQDLRAGRDGEGLNRVAQPALVHLLGYPAHLDRDGPHDLGGGLVADKGDEGLAVADPAAAERRVHITCSPRLSGRPRPWAWPCDRFRWRGSRPRYRWFPRPAGRARDRLDWQPSPPGWS